MTYSKISLQEAETCPMEELKAEIERLTDLVDFFESKQLALKLFINSIYGSLASKFCVLHNLKVAESITKQGQDLNHYSENCMNEYFSGVFQNDEALHKELGIDHKLAKNVSISKGKLTKTGPFNTEEFSYLKGDDTLTVVGDTDSIYCEFGRITNQLNIPKDQETKFIVNLWKKGCYPFMKQKYEEYAKAYNCDSNIQELELEKISRTAIVLAKKHYALDECWAEGGAEGIYFGPQDKVKYTGLEVVQGGTPAFTRQCHKDFYNFCFQNFTNSNEMPSFISVVNKIKEYKEKFVLQNLNDICKGMSITDYDSYILDDCNSVSVNLHCPINVKAAATYNYFLHQNPKYKGKYQRIKSGDKIKLYYTTKPNFPVFAFLPNYFPAEFALPIDYDLMFEKGVLNPLNKVINIFGYKDINSNLSYSNSLW